MQRNFPFPIVFRESKVEEEWGEGRVAVERGNTNQITNGIVGWLDEVGAYQKPFNFALFAFANSSQQRSDARWSSKMFRNAELQNNFNLPFY